METEEKDIYRFEKGPTPEVLKAFGLSGEPVPLSGGQGECYRLGDYVLKPYREIEDAIWIHSFYDEFESDNLCVPKPLSTNDGSWLYEGWGAITFLEGYKDADIPMAELMKLNSLFHQEVSNVPKPDMLDDRKNVWAMADRMCWQEEPVPDYDFTNDIIKRVFSLLKPTDEPYQLIHGDFGPGNILIHDTLPPAVIDLSPYWRPANLSNAVMLVDEVAYGTSDSSLFDLGKDIPNFNQYLLRAATRRLCEYICHELHPENDTDRRPAMKIHMDIIEEIIKKYFNEHV